jgi:hypothetical protein
MNDIKNWMSEMCTIMRKTNIPESDDHGNTNSSDNSSPLHHKRADTRHTPERQYHQQPYQHQFQPQQLFIENGPPAYGQLGGLDGQGTGYDHAQPPFTAYPPQYPYMLGQHSPQQYTQPT